MERRSFLKKAGVGLAAGAVAAPAIGQGTQPEVKWRMASSFPKAWTRSSAAPMSSPSACAAATNGKFQIQVFAGGEIVPAFGVVDAVQNATVAMLPYRAVLLLRQGPDIRVRCAIPFGLNARQQNAWMYHGGGLELMREFFKDYNIINFLAGNTGAQMGGWFRKEIKTVADLKGLKMRIGGTGGCRWPSWASCRSRFPAATSIRRWRRARSTPPNGSVPTTTRSSASTRSPRTTTTPAGGRAARNSTATSTSRRGRRCPRTTRRYSRPPATRRISTWSAKYDSLNPAALKRLIGNGVKLQPFSNDIWPRATRRRRKSTTRSPPRTRSSRRSTSPGRSSATTRSQWFAVAENRFDNFMIAAERMSRKKLGNARVVAPAQAGLASSRHRPGPVRIRSGEHR